MDAVLDPLGGQRLFGEGVEVGRDHGAHEAGAGQGRDGVVAAVPPVGVERLEQAEVVAAALLLDELCLVGEVPHARDGTDLGCGRARTSITR